MFFATPNKHIVILAKNRKTPYLLRILKNTDRRNFLFELVLSRACICKFFYKCFLVKFLLGTSGQLSNLQQHYEGCNIIAAEFSTA